MTFIKRFQNVLRSNINALIDSMEDPQKIMDLLILEMKEQEKKAKRKLIEIKALKQQTLKNNDEKEAKTIGEQELALQQAITLIPQQIEAAKKKQGELSKKLIKAKLAGRAQELEDLSQMAKDYVHDTTALDTYERMIEKIEYAESFANGLEEIATTKKAASRIEDELAALKAKLKK